MKLHYGWVVVAAGALMSCVALGTTFSLAVFLQPMADATGWSRTGISSAMTIVFVMMGVGGFGWGALTDRFGPRIVVLSGGVLLGLGLMLASRADSLLEFQLIYGIFVGGAAGAVFAPTMATVTGWFDKHRSLAVSLVSAGMGVAPMTVSPFAGWLITSYEWRTAQLCIAILAWALLVPAALLVRRPPMLAAQAAGGPAAPDPAVGDPGMNVGQALRTPQFLVLATTFFACCATHSGPIFHTVSYAMLCGLAPLTAVTIYSVEGLAGLGGRLAFGLAGDKFGAKRALVVGLLIQALAAGCYFFTRELGEFYAVAIVFGFAYGGVMPLYAVIAREYFPMRIMGAVFGAATMVSCLGMAFGPAVGGWIYDTTGGYGWLYIGSFIVGLGAVAIALTFPPAPLERRRVAQPA
ncbi:MAG TPA: MFS transporter [Dongiaceae bacterium]|jgi:MFS family permease|nr:MFS transporter [Dongiaceae bacterium]